MVILRTVIALDLIVTLIMLICMLLMHFNGSDGMQLKTIRLTVPKWLHVGQYTCDTSHVV